MNTLKKVADKLASDPNHQHSHTDVSGTTVHSGSHSSSSSSSSMRTSEVITGERISTSTVQSGVIVDQRQVGTVDIVETVQQVRKVPVVETTRAVETINTGVAQLDIASKVALAATADSRTVVVEPVVEEVVRKDVLVQVQPVIHKEVETEEVHHIVKHINEAPAPSLSGKVTLAPVVQEHVHTHIIEEIHPVIHREIALQQVERVEEHITEHIVVPAKHVHEVITQTEVLPVHVHGAECHHAVATEQLTNIIVPGAAVHAHGHGHAHGHVDTVTTREVLVGAAGPAVTIGRTSEVVTDQRFATGLATATTTGLATTTSGFATTTGLATTGAVITDRHLATDATLATGVITDVHTTKTVGFDSHAHAHGTTGLHTDRVVETVEIVEGGHDEKKHHHLHLPHFLHTKKKEEEEGRVAHDHREAL